MTTDGSAHALPVLRGPRLILRPALPEDLPALHEVMIAPEVACWWGELSATELAQELESDEVHTFVIERLGQTIGMLQYSEETDPQYHSAGLDIALAAQHQGQGLGPEALSLLVQHLFQALGHHRLTIDPSVANERAIAAYRKIGFRPVGVMRGYERGPDGTFHDGLLMDMLVEDFQGLPSRGC